MPENENRCDTCTSSLGRPCPDARRLECYAPDWEHYERRLSIDTAPGKAWRAVDYSRVVAPRNDESDCPAPLAPPRGNGAPESEEQRREDALRKLGELPAFDATLLATSTVPRDEAPVDDLRRLATCIHGANSALLYGRNDSAKRHLDNAAHFAALLREEHDATDGRDCSACPFIADLQRELGESEAALDEATEGAKRAVVKVAELTVRLSDLGRLHAATLERLHDLERRCPPTSADTLAQIRDLSILAMEESEEKTRRHAEACLDILGKRDEMERRLTMALETTEMQRKQLAAVADLARQAQRDGGIGEVGR